MSGSSDSTASHGDLCPLPDKCPPRISVFSASDGPACRRHGIRPGPDVRKDMVLERQRDRCQHGTHCISLRIVCVLVIVSGTSVAPAAQGQWVQKNAATQATLTPHVPGHAATGTVVPEASAYLDQKIQKVPEIRQAGYAAASITQVVESQPLSVETSSVTTNTPSPPPFIDLTNETAEVAGGGDAEPTHTDMLIRLATWTVIVMCLCGLTVLAIRRWQTKHGLLAVARGQSQIVETVVLGPNRSVSLVELRGVQALVGCDAGGIQSIVPVPPAFPDILGSDTADSTLSQTSDAHIDSTS